MLVVDTGDDIHGHKAHDGKNGLPFKIVGGSSLLIDGGGKGGGELFIDSLFGQLRLLNAANEAEQARNRASGLSDADLAAIDKSIAGLNFTAEKLTRQVAEILEAGVRVCDSTVDAGEVSEAVVDKLLQSNVIETFNKTFLQAIHLHIEEVAKSAREITKLIKNDSFNMYKF